MAIKKQRDAGRKATAGGAAEAGGAPGRTGGSAAGAGQAPATPHDTYFRYVFQQPDAGRELAVHLLFEHKSRNDPGTIYQLMRYNAVARTALQAMYCASRMIMATMQEEGYTVMREPMISYAEALRREGEAAGVKKGKAEGKREGKKEVLAEALIRLMNRRFTMSKSDLQKIRTVCDLGKLQAALYEIIEPTATLESVLRQLE